MSKLESAIQEMEAALERLGQANAEANERFRLLKLLFCAESIELASGVSPRAPLTIADLEHVDNSSTIPSPPPEMAVRAPSTMPPDPISDDVPPPRTRSKELPRTCVEWASDDASWDSYVASIARSPADHPAKKYTAAQLEDLRVRFRTDLRITSDYARYPRPGAKFTKWLETVVSVKPDA
jgi:hypothetical protein